MNVKFLEFKKSRSLRKKGFDPFVIQKLFDLLEVTLDQLCVYDIGERIWNPDKSSLSIHPRETKCLGAVDYPPSMTINTYAKENMVYSREGRN